MPTVAETTESRHPVLLIKAAIARAAARGITVELGGPLGVRYVHGSRPRWVVDVREASVSPLGAVLLDLQPEGPTDIARSLGSSSQSLDGFVSIAVAEALDVHLAYVEGLLCGMDHMEPSGAWVRSPKARFYLAGIAHGARFRLDWMTLKCERHGRVYRRGQTCGACAREGLS